MFWERTCAAEDSAEGRGAAVAAEASVSLQAAALVAAEGAVAAAVTRAPGSDPRCDPGPLLQVQRDSVQLQGADAATEALLPGRSAAWEGEHRESVRPEAAKYVKNVPGASVMHSGFSVLPAPHL